MKTIMDLAKAVSGFEHDSAVNIMTVKYRIKTCDGKQFDSINSKIVYYEGKMLGGFDSVQLSKINTEIMKDLDEKETKLVVDYKLRNNENKKCLVRREVPPELVEVMGLPKKATRVIVIHPMMVKNPKTNNLAYAVYGYSLVLVTEMLNDR